MESRKKYLTKNKITLLGDYFILHARMWQRFLTLLWQFDPIKIGTNLWICSVFTKFLQKEVSIAASATDALFDFTLDRWPALVPRRSLWHCQLCVWRAWVQDPRTYSTRRGWCAFTSESNFMQTNFSLQSELRWVFWVSSISRFRYPFTSHCIHVCSLDVEPCWFDVVPPSPIA